MSPTRIEQLELAVDSRMPELRRELLVQAEGLGWGPADLQVIAAFLRAAYGNGYVDALSEPVRGELCKTMGYRVPKRLRPSAAERRAT